MNDDSRPRRPRARPRELTFALGLALLCGCSTLQREPQAEPPSVPADPRAITLSTVVVRPGSPGATTYGAPVEHELGRTEQAIADALSELPMRHDPALSRMARELAGMPDATVAAPALVDGLMAWAGLVHPAPRLVTVELGSDRRGCHRRPAMACQVGIRELVSATRNAVPDPAASSYGVGVAGLSGGRTRMIVAALEPTVELEPIPVVMEAEISLAGTLLGGRTAPELTVDAPSGRLVAIPVALAAEGRFTAQVGCEHGIGLYRVELVAEGPLGTEVVANFPVYCKATPPEELSIAVEVVGREVTAEQITRALVEALDEERRERGLPPLEWDAAAAAVAGAHAKDMLEHGFVGSLSPSAGDATARFAAAGVRAATIRENVGRGYGPHGLHESWMRSPASRASILAEDVTRVGVGVVIGSPETEGSLSPLFATQSFYREPGAGAPTKDLGPALQTRVDELRKQRELGPLRWSEPLSSIAQRLAEARGSGHAEPEGWQDEVSALGYASVELAELSSADWSAFAKAELWPTLVHDVGVGVVRVEGKDGATFIAVVLVAKRQ